MSTFGWVAGMRDPPWQWDLRRLGWTLFAGEDGLRAECRHVLLVDARGLGQGEREALVAANGPSWRLLMLGIEEPAERAELLTLGCAEAMPAVVGLRELAARARRVGELFGMMPRWRSIGPLTLDLLHRDARLGGKWLALHPREFGVLWRLADTPGQRVSRRQLLRDVWRLHHEPETNSVEVHVSRLRSKLAGQGCGALIETDPRGGYRLAVNRPLAPLSRPHQEDALDAFLDRRELWPAKADLVENG